MTATTFLDGTTVGQVRRTEDGYLAGRVRCARVGTQLYKRKELKLDGDPEAMVTVYRPESAVFDRASLKTYAGKPITRGHPKTPVGSENWKELAVGTVGSNIVRDGDFVDVDFSIMDAKAIADVEDGTCEVSMGYSTPLLVQDGFTPEGEAYQVLQTGPIRINHLAVVDQARGGKELRLHLDGVADSWGATPVFQSDEETQPMSTKHVVLGDAAVTVPLADAAIIEAFKASLTKQLADAKLDFAKMAEEKDEEIGKQKTKNKQLEDAKITPEKLTKMIADRVALEQNVKNLDDSIICDGVSDEDLRKTAVASKLGDATVADASPAEISGMFKALVHSNDGADDSVRDAFRSRPVNDSRDNQWSDAVAASAGVTFKKGR